MIPRQLLMWIQTIVDPSLLGRKLTVYFRKYMSVHMNKDRKMKKKIITGLIVSILGSGCGSSSSEIQIELFVSEPGTIVVTSLLTGKKILEKQISEKQKISVSRTEMAIGTETLRVSFVQDGKTLYSSLLPKEFQEDIIQINPFTTLSDCIFRANTDVDQNKTINEYVNLYNRIIAQQLGIQQLHEISENDLPAVEQLDEKEKYGFLLRGFSDLSKQYDPEMKIYDFTSFLCDDIVYDQYLNGIGIDGFAFTNGFHLNSQTIKAELAGMVYRSVKKLFQKAPEESLVSWINQISINRSAYVFSNDVENFLFELNPPLMTIWNPLGAPATAISQLSVDFELSDDSGLPKSMNMEVFFTQTGHIRRIENEIDHPNRFISTMKIGEVETGGAMLKVTAEDVFGNISKWEYPIQIIGPS
jgi:hypothetical protein